MNKKEFKLELEELLKQEVDNLIFEEKIEYIKKIILDYEIEISSERILENKGKKWEDYELEIILNSAPSKENILKYAKLFKRGYGSIEQIYRWAYTPFKNMTDERKNDSFILQIKRIAKKIGLRG